MTVIVIKGQSQAFAGCHLLIQAKGDIVVFIGAVTALAVGGVPHARYLPGGLALLSAGAQVVGPAAIAAAGNARYYLRGPGALFRNDIDDAADGISPVQGGGAAADHFDPFDAVIYKKRAEIDDAGAVTGPLGQIHAFAVDEDDDPIRAQYVGKGFFTGTAMASHHYPADARQGIGESSRPFGLQFGAGDNGDVRRRAADSLDDAVSRYGNLIQLKFSVLRRQNLAGVQQCSNRQSDS